MHSCCNSLTSGRDSYTTQWIQPLTTSTTKFYSTKLFHITSTQKSKEARIPLYKGRHHPLLTTLQFHAQTPATRGKGPVSHAQTLGSVPEFEIIPWNHKSSIYYSDVHVVVKEFSTAVWVRHLHKTTTWHMQCTFRAFPIAWSSSCTHGSHRYWKYAFEAGYTKLL